MAPRVLVTGAGGFVGRPAVAELRRRGYEVHGAGRHRPMDLEVDEWHTVDLLEPDGPVRVVGAAQPSCVLHLAWCTVHGAFWEDPSNEPWSDATVRLGRAARDASAARFVFGGSCTQYAWTQAALGPEGVAHEASTPRRAAHRYGIAKERTVTALEAIEGLAVATGLIFFPYGPHEKPERLVPSIARKLLAAEPAETTPGTQVRDFLHVEDCGRALAALVESHVTGTVNIGSGEGNAVADVARTVARICGREDLLRLGALPDRPGEPPRLVADVTRLRAEVGYQPAFGFADGLRDAVEWWVSERDGDSRRATR